MKTKFQGQDITAEKNLLLRKDLIVYNDQIYRLVHDPQSGLHRRTP